tara:strand:- start:20 stop:220 length:201 start_codon:yes stop_codon:yes gene_type:complete
MAHPMCPIVAKVIQEKQEEKCPDVIWDMKECEMLIDQRINTDGKNFDENSGDLRDHSAIDICNSII